MVHKDPQAHQVRRVHGEDPVHGVKRVSRVCQVSKEHQESLGKRVILVHRVREGHQGIPDLLANVVNQEKGVL
jgi:hypothetical protein